jgi:GTP-binding protein HflX
MTRVHGRLLGLKASQVRAIEKLHQRRVPPEWPVTYELLRELCGVAQDTGRCLGLLLDRRGRVAEVLAGDAHHVDVPDLWRDRVAPDRLRGLRLVFTVPASGEITHRALMQLPRFRLDMLVQVEADASAEPTLVRMATLNPDLDAGGVCLLLPTISATAIKPDFPDQMKALETEMARRTVRTERTGSGEAALLVGVFSGAREPAEASLRELQDLARAALLHVAGNELQRRPHPDPRTLVGKGKIEDLVQKAALKGASILVIDGELSGTQARNLAQETGLSVIDRTDLILRIFERRARTRDSKIRVELARLRYQLPRLVRQDEGFSRIGGGGAGGAGVRGKGERTLELGRRQMRDRIHRLEQELEHLGRQRQQGRRRRERTGIPVVALVGYTNAGKSTLLNGLTEADVLAEDLLFATLDTTTRRLRLPSGKTVLVTDTVGFLRELPEGLKDAFRATLDELGEADLLVHVVDAADPDFTGKLAAVERTLGELGLTATPRLTLFNKADRVDAGEFLPLANRLGGLPVSALDPESLTRVRAAVDAALSLPVVEEGP